MNDDKKKTAHKVFLMMEVFIPNNKHIFILLWSLATFLTMQICHFISSFFGLYNSKNYIWSCTWFKILNISGTTLIIKLVIAYLKYSNSLNKVWLYIIVLLLQLAHHLLEIFLISLRWIGYLVLRCRHSSLLIVTKSNYNATICTTTSTSF